MEKHQNKYRYEIKYLVSKLDESVFLRDIILNGFLEIYSKRKINNVYFEDYSFNSYIDNHEGYSKREKIRIRWYGDTYSKSNKKIEFKIKKEYVNYKKFFDLGEIIFIDPIEKNDFKEAIMPIQDLELQKKMFDKFPIVFNSYKRSYYLNKNLDIRITIDNDLKFKSFLSNNLSFEKNLIVEIKYDQTNNFINNLNSYMQSSKYSKYMTGIKFDIEKS